MARETLFAMPSSSILLVFSSVALGFANALPWAEAEQTATYTPHEWSPRPTGAPHAPAELFKRDSVGVGVCGWIGGDKGKAVTCDAGSSCVHDTLHVLVGCCTTDGPCTNGVYTTCQDHNSPGWASSASIANNGVLTCSSSAACYQNTYPGDYHQWACGDATQGTSLVTSYQGQPTDMRLQVVYTGVVFSPMPAKPSSSSSAILVDSSAAPPVPSSATTPTPAAFGKVAPTVGGDGSTSTPSPVAKSNTGAVAGGTVAAVAGVAMVAAIGFWLLRRRQRNQKQRKAGSYLGGRGISPPILQGHSFSSQPFQPVRSESPGPAPENWVSPMTGHPNNAPTRSIFPPASETAYHGSGGAGGLVNIDVDDDASHHSSRHSPRSLAHGFDDPTPQPPPTQTFPNISVVPPQASPAQYSPPPPSQFPQFSPPRPASQPYFPPPPEHKQITREQAIPLVNHGQASEIDDFSQSWNNAVAHHDPIDRDTHIHTGTLPDTRTGMNVGLSVPLRKAVPQIISGQARSIDREARSEALREMGRSENVRMEGWSPRRLRTVRDRAESVASGRASPAFSSRSIGEKEKEVEIPAKSPLRRERMSFGLGGAISGSVAGGNRQEESFQLVEEIMGRRRNEAPVLNSPGGLRGERQRGPRRYEGL